MAVSSSVRAVLDGPRTEDVRRWLLGPTGVVAWARSLAAERAAPEALGDLSSLGDWIDDASFASEPRPSDRLKALLALTRLSSIDPQGSSGLRDINQILDTVRVGYPWPNCDLVFAPVEGDTGIDVVVRAAAGAGAFELEHLVRVIHNRIRSTRRRVAAVALPASAHRQGEMMLLHVTRVAGPPGLIVDRIAAPFLDHDEAFAAAIERAYRAWSCGFAARWHVTYERSGRPVEQVMGPSCGLAAAAAFRSLETGAAIPRDLAFTGDVDIDGSIATLVRNGADQYEAKLEAAWGRRLVVPVVDVRSVSQASQRRTRGPVVLGIAHVADLDALLEPGDCLPGVVAYPRVAGGASHDGGLIGRNDEIAVLHDLVQRGRGPRVALVTGRSGIGKSAVLDWFAQGLPILDRIDGSDQAHTGRLRAAVERVTPTAIHASASVPVVVVDDAHRLADDDIRAVSDVVLSDVVGEIVIVLATAAHVESSALRELFEAAAGSHPHVVGLELGPLTDAAIEAIVDQIVEVNASSLGPNFAARVASIAQGDPFVAMLLVQLADKDEGIVRGAVGDRTRDLASQLVDVAARSLPMPDVLEAAAVLGHAADDRALQAVTRLSPARFREVVQATVASGLMVESGAPPRFRCTHDIVARSVIASLTSARRNQLHRRIATHLESLEPTAARIRELAFHYCSVDPPELDPRALDRSLDAAMAAENERDFDAASGWYDQAVGLAGKVAGFDVLVRAQIGLGRARRRAGRAGARGVLLTAARRAADLHEHQLLVEAVLAAHRGYFSSAGRVDNEWIELLERAADVVDERSARAEILAVLAAELTWQSEPTRRRALSDEALALALEHGSLLTVARVRYRRSLAIAEANSVGEREANALELAEIAQRIGDDETRFAAAITQATIASEVARMDEALVAVHDAEALAEQLRDRIPRFSARLARAGSLLSQGVVDAAAKVSEEALTIGLAADAADAAMLHGEQAWEIARVRGDHDSYRSMAALVADMPDAGLATFGARYSYEAGAVEVARSAYSRLRERGDTIIEPGLAETAVERDLAVLARRFDDPVTAEWLVRRLRSRPDHFANTTIVRPSGRHALALAFATLGRFDEADYWFEGAAHLHTKCRVPLLLAETFVEWAAAVTDLVGNAGRASELLDHAQAIAERHTAPGIDERIRRERERAHLAPERVER